MNFCNEFLPIDYDICTHFYDYKLAQPEIEVINHTKSVKYQKYIITVNSYFVNGTGHHYFPEICIFKMI